MVARFKENGGNGIISAWAVRHDASPGKPTLPNSLNINDNGQIGADRRF